jgi:hypothetical protein
MAETSQPKRQYGHNPLWYILLTVLLTGCNQKNAFDRYTPVLDIFPDAPVTTLYINETDIIDVKPGGYEIISAPEGANYDAGAGRWPSVMGGSIFNSGFNSPIIKEIDLETGELLSERELEGEGPGEYRHISYYETGDGYHFIADLTLGKIIQYDSEWSLVEEFILEEYTSQPFNNLAYSDSVFYHAAGFDSDYLITALRFGYGSTSSHSFHERIIPVGKQPRQYNQLLLDSHNGQLAVMNPSLPYVFMYDSTHALMEIVQVEFPGLNKIEGSGSASRNNPGSGASNSGQSAIVNPPPIPIETDKRINMNPYIIDVELSDNRLFIYYANRFVDLRFLTVLKKEAGGWEPEGSYRFLKEDGSLFTIFAMTYDDGWLYFGGMFEEDIIRMKVG